MSEFSISLNDALRAMIGEQPEVSTPATPALSPAQIADAIKAHAKAGTDLSAVHAAASEAQAKAEALQPLKDAAAAAKQQGVKAKRFVLAFRTGGSSSINTTEGVVTKNGEVHVTPKLSTPYAIDGLHSSLASLKAKMDSERIAHHIDYLD